MKKISFKYLKASYERFLSEIYGKEIKISDEIFIDALFHSGLENAKYLGNNNMLEERFIVESDNEKWIMHYFKYKQICNLETNEITYYRV